MLFDGHRVDRRPHRRPRHRQATASRSGTFEPGADIHAKVTIFADGVRGNLTKELIRVLQLGEHSQPAQFAIGIKELWEIPEGPPGAGHRDPHAGLPAARRRSSAAAGSTRMPDGRVSIGFVVGLDYKDPLFDPHAAFQHFKLHPFVAGILEGGQMVRYGAKALPEGGWNTQPRLFMDGGADRRRRRATS